MSSKNDSLNSHEKIINNHSSRLHLRWYAKLYDSVRMALMGWAIDYQNFRPRTWNQILVGCSIEYRRPYALRHSAISHALANGANPIAIAEQTGHSPKVLLETYAHAIAKEYLFVEV